MKLEGLIPYPYKNFNLNTLVVESASLKGNPAKDPSIRHNVVLSPKTLTSKTPVILYLSGFSSDGWSNFSFSKFENNTSQNIDQWTSEGLIPPALYVFVNAWTKWGGSQFMNSEAQGHYEDYIIQDLVSEIKKEYPEIRDSKQWSIFGGSSGGFGALHLGTKHPQIFQNIVALAPDSLFNVSLLPEIYKFLPYLKDIGGVQSFEDKLKQGLLKLPSDIFFGLMNFIAVTSCYAPLTKADSPKLSQSSTLEFEFPIRDNGDLDNTIWNQWLKHDPIEFLPLRKTSIEKLKSIRLYTGHKDEHGLQYGSRKIIEILNAMDVKAQYTELSGTHRSLGQFRQQALIDLLT